jgi:hypothetical protein
LLIIAYFGSGVAFQKRGGCARVKARCLTVPGFTFPRRSRVHLANVG